MADVSAWLCDLLWLNATLTIVIWSFSGLLWSVRTALRRALGVREAWADFCRPRTRTRARKMQRTSARNQSMGGRDS